MSRPFFVTRPVGTEGLDVARRFAWLEVTLLKTWLEVALLKIRRQRRSLVLELFHHLRARPAIAEVWTVVALVDLEDDDDGHTETQVTPLLLVVDEHGRHQVVVDEEHEEEDGILLPNGEDLTPVEVYTCLCAANGHAHHWRHEQHGPQHDVDNGLCPLVFLKCHFHSLIVFGMQN